MAAPGTPSRLTRSMTRSQEALTKNVDDSKAKEAKSKRFSLFPSSLYVPPEALEQLKHYKYASVDKSFISYYFCRPYWNWAITLFPMWIAPNLITLIGFGFMIFNLILVLIVNPTMGPYAPPWLCYSGAIGLWLYSTFDNVDGRQARRTGTSSPLGELFDHGCDALNCAIGGLIQSNIMGLGMTWYSAFVPGIAILPFYMSTWEEYYTGVLYLGYINGPTEGLIIACLCMILTGVYGPGLWQHSLGYVVGAPLADLLPVLLVEMSLVDIAAYSMWFMFLIAHAPFCLYAVYGVCVKKGLSFTTAVLQLIPIIIYFIAGYLWLAAPGSLVLTQHLPWFVLALGIVFGRIATKIILAHLTKQPFPYYTFQMVPLLIGATFATAPQWLGRSLWTPEQEYTFLISYLILVIVSYLHWAFAVIDCFCSYLGIRCLVIPKSAYAPTKTA